MEISETAKRYSAFFAVITDNSAPMVLIHESNDAVRATAIVNQRLHEVSPHTRNLHQPAAVPKIETDLCLTIDNYRLFPW